MSRVFLLSGQGSFRPGMGKRLYDELPAFRESFCEASECLEEDVASLCWGDRRTRVKGDPYREHVAIWSCAYALHASLSARGILPDVLMGHSLGEIISFCLSGAISLEDASRLIKLRGRLFAENKRNGASDLVAVLGEERALATIEEAVARSEGIYPANYNTPRQTVFAVSADRITDLHGIARGSGARCVALGVGNGCHSPYVAAIDEPLRSCISELEIVAPRRPVYSCSSMEMVDSPERTREVLSAHLLLPVRWYQSLYALKTSLVRVTMYDLDFSKIIRGLVLAWDRQTRLVSAEALLKEAV